jgi:hypothetical protein
VLLIFSNLHKLFFYEFYTLALCVKEQLAFIYLFCTWFYETVLKKGSYPFNLLLPDGEDYLLIYLLCCDFKLLAWGEVGELLYGMINVADSRSLEIILLGEGVWVGVVKTKLFFFIYYDLISVRRGNGCVLLDFSKFILFGIPDFII